MKTNYLLPNRFKRIGWVLFIPAAIGAIYYLFEEPEPAFLNIKVFSIAGENTGFPFDSGSTWFSLVKDNVLNELIMLLLIVSSLFIAFSREKKEDEFISRIRLESLVWATWVNYAILILTIVFVFGLDFFVVMELNMFTLLVFFIARFNWALYRLKRSV